MPSEGTYPNIPRRPNFTDIRTMQIFDPVVMGSNATIGDTWEALSLTGGTLENGVRIKNSTLGGTTTLWISTTSAGTGATAEQGFYMAKSDEVFIEVRQLSDVWVIGHAANNCEATFIAS